MNNPKISICIPTYNRADLLVHSLRKILLSSNIFLDKVEVIVSDNHSVDNTESILAKLKMEFPFLRSYRNDNNIGFNLNFFKLVDNYAKGEYLWIIGDDDFVDEDALDSVLKVLERYSNLNFLGLNFRLLAKDDAVAWEKEVSENLVEITTTENAINLQSKPQNLLTTFLSCNIIKRKIYLEFDKSIFSNDSWDNYMSVFPHSYMIANQIPPKSISGYISNPLLSVCVHEKAWDDKLSELQLVSIVSLYQHFKKFGYHKLNQAKIIIIKSGLLFLTKKNVKLKFKLHFLKFAIFSTEFYRIIFTYLLHKKLK